MSLSFSTGIPDADWGCSYQEVADSLGLPNIKACFVTVENLTNFSNQLSSLILDTSWMMELDRGIRRQYDYTVRETAALLLATFKETSEAGTIGAEFGELMVSIGSARGLEQIFRHMKVPLAELWKPQAKQNEGFDFHTVCTAELIHFGEAKYSGKNNPHGLAITQAEGFLDQEKHLRDRAHLINFVKAPSIDQLDSDKFGVIAAFSVNSDNPLTIFKNALESAVASVGKKNISSFYLVGVGANIE